MAIYKLSARKVSTADEGKYEDGQGLRLVVSSTGAKKWVLRFTLKNRRREMGLGSYPTVSLEHARKLAGESRLKVLEGIDPIHHRQISCISIPTFAECAIEYIDLNKAGWSNAKHQNQWLSTLSTYAFPLIGDQPVDSISTDQILALLTPIWLSKNETAKRVQTRIAKILDYAKARNLRSDENPARWQGHLDTILPKPSSVQKGAHHPAMPYSLLPSFWRKIQSIETSSSKALQLLVLTACRTSEVLQAKWDEIDFAERLWTIPASRMKAGKEHRVPLSNEALSVLQKAHRESGNPYIFIGGKKGSHLSNMALLKFMRDLGYGSNGDLGDYVPHGFRSTFRDWAGEVSSYPQDVAEMALAHTIKNKVEAAYRRGDLLAKRASMMNEWAQFVANHN